MTGLRMGRTLGDMKYRVFSVDWEGTLMRCVCTTALMLFAARPRLVVFHAFIVGTSPRSASRPRQPSSHMLRRTASA